MSLEGRIALVTGGGRGIGRAIALGLAEDGADVAVNFVSNEEAAKEVVTEIEKLGRRAKAYRADVGKLDEVDAMVSDVVNELGHVDILVNNALAIHPFANALRMPIEEFERQLNVSALGPARLTQLVIPIMRKRPRGDIVMISSVATKYFPQFTVPYQMGKAAMEALAYTVAREERRNGIRVNVVRPGLIATDAGQILTTMLGAGDIEELDRRSPFGRLGRPEDVAGVVRMLVSDQASFVSGQCIDVDGGGGMETRINAWTDAGALDFAEEFGRLREMKRSR